jgi:hypothetical protein
VPLSYGTKPALSYVKSESEELDPEHYGEVDIPSPGPEPGSRLHQHPPQVAQPTAISLNSEGE